jgi:hypothetical protein
MSDWFYRDGDKEHWPIKLEELLALIQSKELPADAPVRAATSTKWMRADALIARLKKLRSNAVETTSPTTAAESAVAEPEPKAGLVVQLIPPAEASLPASAASRRRHVETKRSYPMLLILITLYRMIALLAVVTILVEFMIVGNDSQMTWLSLVSVIPRLVVGVVALAISESIRLALDIESNTRRAADLLEVLAAERLAA